MEKKYGTQKAVHAMTPIVVNAKYNEPLATFKKKTCKKF